MQILYPPLTHGAVVMGLLLCSIIAACITSSSMFVHSYPITPINSNIYDMGVAVDKGNARGVVVTLCGQPPLSQFECILSPMMDFWGMFAMLVVHAETGNTTRVDFPFTTSQSEAVYASLLSNDGRYYYCHYGGRFVQFDAQNLRFSFVGTTLPGMSMKMTLDDFGNVWSATYPKSGLVSFNPNTRVLTDYGYVYNQTWLMYQRYIAADDQGFIYFSVGYTLGQIIAFNPNTSSAVPVFSESERGPQLMPTLYRDVDGAVYASNVNATPIYRFYRGNYTTLNSHAKVPVPYISGHQGLFYGYFPSKRQLLTFDVENKIFTIREKNSTMTTKSFYYTCRGANLMDLRATPDFSTLIGGSSFPMNFFTMNSTDGVFQHSNMLEQPNVIQAFTYDPYVWIGTYPVGRLLQYDLKKPWIDPIPGNASSLNPRILASAAPHIIRPTSVLAHPNKELVFMGGTPDYGGTGGGLLIWNRITEKATVFTHTQLLQYHSINSMVPIPGSNDLILCGSTIVPGTGGVAIAPVAELFVFNITSRSVTWRSAPLTGVRNYYELYGVASTGFIYGYTDTRVFFVFNPSNRSLIHVSPISGVYVEQGPHSFAPHPNGKDVYVTLGNGIFQIHPQNFTLTRVMSLPSAKTYPFNGVILKNGWYYYRSDTRIHGFKLFNVTKEPPVLNSPLSPSISRQVSARPSLRHTSGVVSSAYSNYLRGYLLVGWKSMIWLVASTVVWCVVQHVM